MLRRWLVKLRWRLRRFGRVGRFGRCAFLAILLFCGCIVVAVSIVVQLQGFLYAGLVIVVVILEQDVVGLVVLGSNHPFRQLAEETLLGLVVIVGSNDRRVAWGAVSTLPLEAGDFATNYVVKPTFGICFKDDSKANPFLAEPVLSSRLVALSVDVGLFDCSPDQPAGVIATFHRFSSFLRIDPRRARRCTGEA